jgi:flagellar motor switch protein FliG
LASLPAREASELLAQLDPPQAEAVLAEVARAGAIPPGEQRSVIHEFAARSSPSAQASYRLDSAHATRQGLFDFLADLDQEQLYCLLADEHPQTIALVLSHLRADRAAELTSSLPPETQRDVVGRVAQLAPVPAEIAADVSRGLRLRAAILAGGLLESSGGPHFAGELLRHADRVTRTNVLAGLDQLDPRLAAQLRSAAK